MFASADEETVGVSAASKCPFLHGTVYAQLFPGYVHGNQKSGVCPHQCRPKLNAELIDKEEVKETLLREAFEYQELYYAERATEMGTKIPSKEDRWQQILASVDATGTYEHTFDELEHGMRVAWRNAPKCSNRKFWNQVKLLDRRKVTTNQGMFDACLEHIELAMESGVTDMYLSCFKAAVPGTEEGPRVWNDQLLRYACYRDEKKAEHNAIVGDPVNFRFTELLEQRFGWKGPPDGVRSAHDYLPLVLQVDPTKPPEMFELPINCAPPVHIHHPDHPYLANLDMQWYPIPAVSALDLTVGGLLYTAVPFNGWYADVEVVRDLCDEHRFNMLKPVAEAMGLEVSKHSNLWVDKAQVVINDAVLHSFSKANVAMIDHHTLINGFWDWYQTEVTQRKYCPTNWKWVIPPQASATNKCYLGLNKAKEYTLKPAYLYGANSVKLEAKFYGQRDKEKARRGLRIASMALMFVAKMRHRAHQKRAKVILVYASVSGTTRKYAARLRQLLSAFSVTFVNAFEFDAQNSAEFVRKTRLAKIVIVATCTYGNGDVPAEASKFTNYVFGANRELLQGKSVAVLGFGSSSYPNFCGAVDILEENLAAVGAVLITPSGRCDAVKGENRTFKTWVQGLITTLAREESASPLVLKMAENMQANIDHSAANASVWHSSRVVARYRGAHRQSTIRIDFMDHAEFQELAAAMLKQVGTSHQAQSEAELDARAAVLLKASLQTRSRFFHGKIVESKSLLPGAGVASSEEKKIRTTTLVSIDLDESGNPPYEPGDHICVLPRTLLSESTLGAFLGHILHPSGGGISDLDQHLVVSYTGDTEMAELEATAPLLVALLDKFVTVRDIFTQFAALEGRINLESCLELSEFAVDDDKSRLELLGRSEEAHSASCEEQGLMWVDLFDLFPTLSLKLSLEFMVSHMSTNHTRSYSIASCKHMVGHKVDICVGRYLYALKDGKPRAGVCSNFLTLAPVGTEVTFRLETFRPFHLPPNPKNPILLLATGTGFAPLRGLIQQRIHFARRALPLGPAVLVTGARTSEEALFKDEVAEASACGALTNVFWAYSREPGKPKKYVTDVLRKTFTVEAILPMLKEAKSHLYVCGSAEMALSVKQVLVELVGEEVIGNMEASNRIHMDIFGKLPAKK